MKVVVLGSGGQLAFDIFRLKPEGVELTGLTRKELDVRDKEALIRTIRELKPDVVINTAAIVRVDDAEIYESRALETNAIPQKTLGELSASMGFSVVYISTDYVFDGTKREPYTEEDRPNPINMYGFSKHLGESLLMNYTDRYYIVRTSALFGFKGSRSKGNVVYNLIRKFREGKIINLIDDVYFSPAYTYDVAQQIWKFIMQKWDHGIYHVVNDGFTSPYGLGLEIFAILGVHPRISRVSLRDMRFRAKRPRFSAMQSIKKVKLRPWQEAVREFLKEIDIQKSL